MKKGQQPKLFLEYIDGSIPVPEEYSERPDKMGIYFTHHLIKMFNECSSGISVDVVNDRCSYQTTIDNLKLHKYFLRNNVGMQNIYILKKFLNEDRYAPTLALSYLKYSRDPNAKNYILSKNLTNYLGKISLDIPSDVLPKKFSAYMESNNLYDDTDGTKVLGVFININKADDCNKDVILIGIITEGSRIRNCYEYRTFHIPLEDRTLTLDQLCVKYTNKNNDSEKHKKEKWWVDDAILASETICIRTILNTILYVNSSNEEFIENFNEFSDKESKRREQLKNASIKKFYKIGYENAKHLKLIVEKDVEVGWHTKMQAYGPGRKYRKRIIVGSYTRTQKSYMDRKK